MSLPTPKENQCFWSVSALEAGLIYLKDEVFMSNGIPGKVTRAPSLSFLLRHSQTDKKFVFDLGIRKDWENYPPKTVEWIKTTHRVEVPQDVIGSLEKGGLRPADIDHVCLSHCHHDHVGDTRPFVNSTFLVGGAVQPLFEPGYPKDPNSRFPSDLLPAERTKFLNPKDWEPIGPFARSLDAFGDGSLYIIDAPGHLAGHINILARTSSDGGWIYLAGDSAHHWDLINLKAEIAVGFGGNPDACVHVDKEAAKEHILRINALTKLPRVQVFLAHDEPWYSNHANSSLFWPGVIQSL